MSAAPQAPSTPPPQPPAPAVPNQITIISHCTLFYWWPVWAVGFLMAGLTYWDHHRMAVVPESTQAFRHVTIIGKETGTSKDVEVIALTPDDREQKITKDMTDAPHDLLLLPKDTLERNKDSLKLHISRNKNYGVLFATVLLVVIVITNVPLRGGWSFAIIVFAILMAVILALANAWESILDHLHLLDIRINVGGYLFISTILFALWLIALLVFDRRIYMTFEPGQIRVCTEIGGGEKVYPSAGAALEKQRSDLFRHWVLGLGSGDLIVRTSGATAHEFDLHNVLFIGKKIHMVESILKKVLVTAR